MDRLREILAEMQEFLDQDAEVWPETLERWITEIESWMAEQKPVAEVLDVDSEDEEAIVMMLGNLHNGMSLYAAPIDVQAIGDKALEDAAVKLEQKAKSTTDPNSANDFNWAAHFVRAEKGKKS